MPKTKTKKAEKAEHDLIMAPYRLSDAISKGIEAGTISVNKKGHLARFPGDGLLGRTEQKLAHEVLKAIKGGKRLPKPVQLDDASCLRSCGICDSELDLLTDGQSVFTSLPCPYPDGFTIEIELNVPSGKIVAADDLREWFDIFGSFNINSSMGCRLSTEQYARIGCAHGYVGNSCPGIYQVDNSKFIIATCGHDEKAEAEDNENDGTIHPGGKRVASIVTDLWWYSLVDGDEFKRRAGSMPKKEYGHPDVFKVKPGVYRVRHFTHDHKKMPNRDDWKVYAEFEWVRDPDPVHDYKADFDAMNFTVGQVIHRSVKDYPRLYGGGERGVRSKADHIMNVIGGGADWHPNGFCLFDPDVPTDEPEIEIPAFEGFYSWYPLSDYSALMIASGATDTPQKYVPKLNPSFCALAFNVARCMTKWGVRPSRDAREKEFGYNVKEARSTWESAQKALLGLAKKYPDQIPENCKWLVKPVIEQANWILGALNEPCWFEWRDKALWIVNEHVARKVRRTKSDFGMYELAFDYFKFGCGSPQTRSGHWFSRMICEFSEWIKGKPHRGIETEVRPGGRAKFWTQLINKFQDGSMMERLESTCYRALSTDWHPVGENSGGETRYELQWHEPATAPSFEDPE